MCPLHGNKVRVTVRPIDQPSKGGSIATVSMLHDIHSSSSSCVLPHIPLTPRLKSKAKPPFSTPLEEN